MIHRNHTIENENPTSYPVYKCVTSCTDSERVSCCPLRVCKKLLSDSTILTSDKTTRIMKSRSPPKYKRSMNLTCNVGTFYSSLYEYKCPDDALFCSIKHDNKQGYPVGACEKSCKNSSSTKCCSSNNCNFPEQPSVCYSTESLRSNVSIIKCPSGTNYCKVNYRRVLLYWLKNK